MHAKLVVVGGDAKAAVIRLKLPTIVGRGRNASLTLPHPLVSRQHCEIVESNGRLLVRDLGSLNGTFIGKERITEAVLPPGELLTIGTVTFRAVYDEPAAEGEQEPGNNGQANPGRGASSVAPSSFSVAADRERAPDGDDGTERRADKSAEDAGEEDEMELLPADPDAELPAKPGGKPLRQLPPAAPRSPAPDSADNSSAENSSADNSSADNSSAENSSAENSSADDRSEDAELLHDDSLEELHLGEVPDEEGVSTIADAADSDDEPSDLGDAAGKHQQLPQGSSTKPSTDEPTGQRNAGGEPERIGPPAEAEIPDDGPADGAPAQEEQADAEQADAEPAKEEPAKDLDDDLRSFLRGFQ